MFVKGQKGGPGRPKGSRNKYTASFRQAVLQTFDNLGGIKGFTEWASENPTDFYRICAQLIPREVHATVSDVRPVIVDTITADDITTERHDVH